MDPYALHAVQWSKLPNIDVVVPLGEDDQRCLDELRAVLDKHGKLSRFGIALLHRHFEIAKNEILLEFCDPVERTLTTLPVVKTDPRAANTIQTIFRFDDAAGTDCQRYCPTGPTGKHYGYPDHI